MPQLENHSIYFDSQKIGVYIYYKPLMLCKANVYKWYWNVGGWHVLVRKIAKVRTFYADEWSVR